MKEVMVVENDIVLRTYITEVLQTKFEAVGVIQAISARDAAVKFHFGIDLLIMGGRRLTPEAALFLRSIKKVYGETRIIMMTSTSQEYYVDQCYDKIIYKPFALEELVNAITPLVWH